MLCAGHTITYHVYMQLVPLWPTYIEKCAQKKCFWIFLNESRITWLLAFHMSENALNRPFIAYWRDIYWASWKHWRRRTFESKETIVHCFPMLYMLESASLCPFEHTLLLFPCLPFLCKLSIEMEDWSGGGPGGGLDFSSSKKCWQSVSLFYLCFINRNIHFMSTMCLNFSLFSEFLCRV